MSLFRLLRRFRLRLVQIQRDFLWDEGNRDKKPHLVKWSMVFANKRNGGLGVRDLSILNRPFCVSGFGALQMKKNALWRNVIC